MLLLGVASIVQIAFLPGWLLLQAIDARSRGIRTLLLSFVLSHGLNYLFVSACVAAGCYQSEVVCSVFAAEVVALLYLTRQQRCSSVVAALATLNEKIKDGFVLRGSPQSGSSAFLRQGLLAAALLTVIGYAAGETLRLGTVFIEWDALASWNRWACDWGANHFPKMTHGYPQLLPACWSLSYAFTGEVGLSVFPKAVMPLYCLFSLLAIYDLHRIMGHSGCALGVVVAYGLMIATLRFRTLASGYADVPVAFFALSAVYLLLIARYAGNATERDKSVLLGAAAAGLAAIAKQAGLYVVVLYPVLAYLLVWTPGRDVDDNGLDDHRLTTTGAPAPRRFPLRLAFLCAALVLFLVLPWYGYKLVQFQRGGDVPMVGTLVTSLHEGRSLVQRLVHGANMLRNAVGGPGTLILLLGLACSLRHAAVRWITFLLVVPFFIVWAIGFSYDLRNLALCLPLAGLACGVGLVDLGQCIGRVPWRLMGKYRPALPLGKVPMTLLTVPVLAPLFVLNARWDRERLWNHQHAMERHIGDPGFNDILYSYFRWHSPRGTILTDYSELQFLPDLAQYARVSGCSMDVDPAGETFIDKYRRPDTAYIILVTRPTTPAVLQYLDSEVRNERATLLAEYRGVRFYEKRSDR
jgi:hypothetical protein